MNKILNIFQISVLIILMSISSHAGPVSGKFAECHILKDYFPAFSNAGKDTPIRISDPVRDVWEDTSFRCNNLECVWDTKMDNGYTIKFKYYKTIKRGISIYKAYGIYPDKVYLGFYLINKNKNEYLITIISPRSSTVIAKCLKVK